MLLLAGALIGGFIGEFASRYPFFEWMSFGGRNGYREIFSFSLNPALDTYVMRFGFSFALRVNAGSILGMVIAIPIFMRINRG